MTHTRSLLPLSIAALIALLGSPALAGRPTPGQPSEEQLIGVPGEPAGLELLSKRYGKKSLAEDAAPAISLAQNGFYLGKHMTEIVGLFKDRIRVMPTVSTSFLPGGVPAPFASRVRRPHGRPRALTHGQSGAGECAGQNQHDGDQQQDADETAGVVAPAAAIGPGRDRAEQQQAQRDEQNGSDRHDAIRSAAISGMNGSE